MRRALRPIPTPVVEPHNEFAAARAPIFPYDSEAQVPAKHDFSDTFEREKFDGETVGKSTFNNLVTPLCRLQSHHFFDFLLYFHLFYIDGKTMDQPRVNGSPNPALIREHNLKPTLRPVKFVDALFPVYKRKKGER